MRFGIFNDSAPAVGPAPCGLNQRLHLENRSTDRLMKSSDIACALLLGAKADIKV